MKQRGFTVIELIIAIAFLIFAGVLFVVQSHDVKVAQRDDQRKTAINAMYYSLENGYYPAHHSYPKEINADILTTMDADLFTDPDGITLGQTAQTIGDQKQAVQSDYRYEPTNCTDSACKSYTLRADLENEADFVKTSQHH